MEEGLTSTKSNVSMLIFDIRGRMAHFRKFYTNSSSLSYDFPPRTVICGLIAGILGMPKDSYYEDFSLNRCRIGVAIGSPLRKIVQTVNFIRT
ncbi:MAG: CRISPR-associated protein Cas5, partial [Thermoplasmata archaeon]